jgi:hypothetical protein
MDYDDARERVLYEDTGRSREFVLIDPQADLEIDTATLLGSGGFGRTMTALFKRGGGSTGAYEHETVAVKMMFCSTKLPEEMLRAFHAEAYGMSQLHHRNIVHMFGACIRPPHLCLVQELAELGRCAGGTHPRQGPPQGMGWWRECGACAAWEARAAHAFSRGGIRRCGNARCRRRCAAARRVAPAAHHSCHAHPRAGGAAVMLRACVAAPRGPSRTARPKP